MKKLKKLRSGMTLVEVVVAMAVFGAMTLAIAMGLSAAVKYNARNLRRDNELTKHQTAIEGGTAKGTAVYNGITDGTLTYSYTTAAGSGSKVINGLSEFKALKTKGNSGDYNFEIKTFSSTTVDSSKTVVDPSKGSYRVTFENQSDCEIKVEVMINEVHPTASEDAAGQIYEGDMKTFVLSSDLYERTVPAVGAGEDYETDGESLSYTGFEIGFKYEDTRDKMNELGSQSVMTVNIRNADTGLLVATQNISASELYSYGQVNFTVVNDGATCRLGSYTHTNIIS